ncbi:MAG: bifunctional DNA-formamidopyrimidine glycosylase/DNA-(apurinic or apyrimidinic site) lyase [Candidatus Omnitrophica bacterium]|nr:bifunctional DNA-formamidopyrimidine glycosylase/DNA-(apurinic or apyrimidinic site) lyase [Candidatus Omnitrophota bacterium]
MPELPEVESVRKSLEISLEDVGLARIDSLFPGVLTFCPTLAEARLPAKFLGADRRGKMLALRFQGEQTLLIHLRMTGRLYFPNGEEPLLPHTHVLLHLEDQRTLAFCDPRRFGRLVWHVGTPFDRIPELNRLGPDALSLSSKVFFQLLKPRNRMIKPLLLDQFVLSGLGNIYVDESLFRAGIHPKQISADLSRKRIDLLWESVMEVLQKAIENGGSTIRDFVGFSGEAGNYQKHHSVYGRAGLECVKCGGTLRRTLVAQRGTTYCPHCQRMRYRRTKGKAIRGRRVETSP